MNDSTGGTVQTGNPQNIGTQNIAQTQTNLQSNNANLLNGSSNLKIVDQNGYTLAANTSTSTQTAPKTSNSHHNVVPVVLISGLLILAVFIATWFMNRSSNLSKY